MVGSRLHLEHDGGAGGRGGRAFAQFTQQVQRSAGRVVEYDAKPVAREKVASLRVDGAKGVQGKVTQIANEQIAGLQQREQVAGGRLIDTGEGMQVLVDDLPAE